MNTKRSLRAGFAGLVVAVMALGGCATPPADDPDAEAEFRRVNDPLEPFNRAMFKVNEGLDVWFLRPAAIFYKDVLPPPVQTGVGNFIGNLKTPVILANDVMQGEGERAGTTVARFLINSTVGVAGIGDPATSMGWEGHDEDFGQTLAVWGVADGPYIVLPVLGPSNPRDIVGKVADGFLDPLNLWAYNTDRVWIPYSRKILSAVDQRAEHFDSIEDLRRTSLDFYAAIRSLYRQRREAAIRNGAPAPEMPAPGMESSDWPGAADEEISSTPN